MIKYLKVSLFIVFALVMKTGLLFADVASVRVYYATGKQSQTDVIEERDLSGNFNFYKFGSIVKALSLDDFVYRVGYEYYFKDFESLYNALDTFINIYNTHLSFPIRKSDKFGLCLNTDYELHTKRYRNNPSSEYDENSIETGIEIICDKNYSLEFSGEFEDYDYDKNWASDYKKYLFKISPSAKLINEQLDLSGFYKRVKVDKSGDKTDYNEDTASIRALFKTLMPIIHKIDASFEQGRNGTQDDEEDREDNLRFKYRLWELSTYYNFYGNNIEDKLTYGQKHRGYDTSINGYDNWYIKDKFDILIFKKETLKLDAFAAGEHKETDFYQNNILSYNKNSVSCGLNLLKRAA